MAQNGGVPIIGQGKMPPVQYFLNQLLEQNQLLITLAETQCRLLLKQTPEEIKATQGISFPIKTEPTKEELIEALESEIQRLAEDGAEENAQRIELLGQQQLAFLETERQADALEDETSEEVIEEQHAPGDGEAEAAPLPMSGETGEDHDTSLD